MADWKVKEANTIPHHLSYRIIHGSYIINTLFYAYKNPYMYMLVGLVYNVLVECSCLCYIDSLSAWNEISWCIVCDI